MSRIRSLKPEFFRSRSLAKVSRDARLSFIGLWTEADDDGNGVADADLLKGALWPKDHDIDASTVEQHLAELAGEHILLYEADGDRYFHIINWERHQAASYRRGEGRYPPPPALCISLHDDACNSHDDASEVVLEGSREQGAGKRSGDAAARRKCKLPEDFSVTDDMAAWAMKTHPTVDLERETVKFREHHEAKGNTYLDWRKAWQTWIRNAEEYATRNGHRAPPKEPFRQGRDGRKVIV